MSQNTTNLKPTKNYLGGNNMTDKDRVRNDAGDGPPPTRYLPSNHNEDIHDFLGNVHSQMRIQGYNTTDNDGLPAQGVISAPGLNIRWQDGPLNRDVATNRVVGGQNGALLTDVLLACIGRLHFCERTVAHCRGYMRALDLLGQARDAILKSIEAEAEEARKNKL